MSTGREINRLSAVRANAYIIESLQRKYIHTCGETIRAPILCTAYVVHFIMLTKPNLDVCYVTDVKSRTIVNQRLVLQRARSSQLLVTPNKTYFSHNSSVQSTRMFS